MKDSESEENEQSQVSAIEGVPVSRVGWGVLLFIIFSGPIPGGTAIPGQPVASAEQALDISPSCKNQFNIEVPRWGTYQILS